MTRGVIGGRQGVDVRGAAAAATGTFGELLQGALPDGSDFLVTLPIALRSHASFRLGHGDDLVVYPSHKHKSWTVARRMLDAAGHPGGTLVIDSAVPTGKGLASSSADLVATARAVGRCLGLPVGPADVQGWIRGVEPTDGVMYDHVVAFDHCAVRLLEDLGPVPALAVVALDEGGRLDTVRFNRERPPFDAAARRRYAELLAALRTALATGDLPTVGAVTTESSRLAQRTNPKRTHDALLGVVDDVGALGVVTTHSGTMTGLLLDAAHPDHPVALVAAQERCAAIAAAHRATTGVFRTVPAAAGADHPWQAGDPRRAL